MTTNKNEAKTMAKHISDDCKCKFNSTICQNGVADDSDIVCDEIIYDMDTVATKMTNAIATINLGVIKLS